MKYYYDKKGQKTSKNHGTRFRNIMKSIKIITHVFAMANNILNRAKNILEF